MYNPFSLQDKTIFVSGASSGIGKGIAIECSKMGANVMISGRNEKRLNETFNSLEGDQHRMFVADLSNQDEIEKLSNELPIINGCVHCAGIPQISSIKHLNRSAIEEIMNINSLSPVILTSLLLKKRKIQRNSSIVFISSISGVYTANIGEATYGMSKGAIGGFVKQAALELANKNIRVNSINPGLVPTGILELSNTLFSQEQLISTMAGRYPLKRFGTPEDVAYGAIYLLSDASTWVTGINLVIDGGYVLA